MCGDESRNLTGVGDHVFCFHILEAYEADGSWSQVACSRASESRRGDGWRGQEAGFHGERERARSLGTDPAETKRMQGVGENLEVGVQQFEMVWLSRWNVVHQDRESPNLSPSFDRVRERAEAGDWVQIQNGTGMNAER